MTQQKSVRAEDLVFFGAMRVGTSGIPLTSFFSRQIAPLSVSEMHLILGAIFAN